MTMYRIMIAVSQRDNYGTLYQYLTTKNSEGNVVPVELADLTELDAYVEDMLNEQGYAKSDFLIVHVVDYVIEASDYDVENTESDGE